MATSVSIGYAPPHPLQQSSSSSTAILLAAVLTAELLICEALGRIAFLLAVRAGLCAVAESRAFWSSGDACFLLRILKLACLSLAPSHGRCEFLIQNNLTTHPVSAAGAFTCTLDSPFLDLSIIYHTNVVLSIFFVRFIQQISPPVFYVLHNSPEIPAKSGPEQAASGPPVTSLPVPDRHAGSRGSGTGAPGTSTPPAPARPALG